MDVTLGRELEAVVEEEVKSGRFADANDFVNAAISYYLAGRLSEGYTTEEMEQLIAEGEDGDPIDGDEAFRMLRADIAERRKRA